MADVSARSKPGMLDGIEILSPLSEKLKTQLAARLDRRTVSAGTMIFNEGEPGNAMYLVAGGEVSVFLTDKTLGLEAELARFKAGEAFGEMAMITGSPRSASARAVQDSELWVLNREVLNKLVDVAPQVGLMIASVLAKRNEEHNRSQWIELGTLRGKVFDPALLDLLPLSLIEKHRYVPFAKGRDYVGLATPDPSNKMGLEDVRQLIGGERVRVMAVPEAEFDAFVKLHFTKSKQKATARPSIDSLMGQVEYLSARIEREKDASENVDSHDIAELATHIIVEGIERGASDIQIEPDRQGTIVRYRVDGLMVPREQLIPRSQHAPLVSRLKVLASLNITERRLPQDGRISLEIAGRPYDLRISTINTSYGEKAVLRVLDASAIMQSLGAFVLSDKVAMVVRRLFQQPHGLVLVTGPTGSGKTTTLYAALRERMGESLSICTAEDPIEYELPGVTQVQVEEAAGLGFAEILRAFLRQAPDIIFLGEMRDMATARLACNAALTGHLVLSSLHTNDALSAVSRLKGMGVEPYLVAGSLLGVVNQRLVRRICGSCREAFPLGEATIESLRSAGVFCEDAAKGFKGRGCYLCGGEGYKGRAAVYELLVMSQKVKDAIAEERDMSYLREVAMDGSYVSLAGYSGLLLAQGATTPEEVLRILPHRERKG